MKNLINIRVLQHDTNDQIRIGMAYPIIDLDKAEKDNVLRFDYWFSFNYKRLRSILGWQLNEDVFHDTYLLLRKDLLFIDLPIIDFEPLFWGIYKRARLRNIAKENRYYRPNEIFSS
jgi:hypothetical protein